MSNIFKRKDKKIFFRHVPKTGGSSLQSLLIDNGWEIEKRRPYNEKLANIEICGSHSHLHHKIIKDYWLCDWEFEFSITRNPYERFRSVLRRDAIQLETEVRRAGRTKMHPMGDSNFIFDTDEKYITHWVDCIFTRNFPTDGVGIANNHFRPQNEFVSDTTKLYKLETIDLLVDDLKRRNYVRRDAILPHLNTFTKHRIDFDISWHNSSSLHNMFIKLYEKDFLMFDYKVRF